MNRSIITILVSMFLFVATASANVYERVLWTVVSEFELAKSKQEKIDILSRKMDGEYLERLKPKSDIDFRRLYEVKGNKYETHAIALAIVHGRLDFLHQVLAVIDDINDEKFLIWGYREWYNMAHLALDPRYPSVNMDVPYRTRRKILKLLVDKGVDLNYIHGGLYANPPIACGRGSGRELPFADVLRADALLYGADPSIIGSYFRLSESNLKWLSPKLAEAAQTFARRGIAINPAEVIRVLLNNEADQ